MFDLGRIIKFNSKHDNEEKDSKSIENNKEEHNFTVKKLIKNNLKEAIENYLLSVFAIKNILTVEYIDKVNRSDVGFIGRVVYEHKRREGIFVADFIGQAVKEKNYTYRIIEIAFETGEPHLYNQIKNILKAKNVLPVIKNQ